jgi:hypothetical protein
MSSIGDEPLSASLEAPTPAPAVSSRRKRHSLIAHYPGVEETTMTRSPGVWGLRRNVGFIVVSAALLWGLVLGAIALLR